MNNSRKLLNSMTITALVFVSMPLSAALSSGQSRQMTQKLQATVEQLATINNQPIMTGSANSADHVTLKNMVSLDIKAIKEDIKRIQAVLKTLVDIQQEIINSSL